MNADRILPHNLDAEKSVLGAILVNNNALPRAQELVKPEDFFRRGHQLLFAAMCRLGDARDGAVDLITIKSELDRTKDLDEAGGAAYISGLTDGVPRSSNVAHYAGIVKEHALRRALIKTATSMLAEAYSGTRTSDEIISESDRSILDLQSGFVSGRMTDLRTTASQLFEDLEHRAQHRGELTGIETGYPSINELTSGWQRGDMIVVAARPSIGKSAFILNTGVATAKSGVGVAIFSLEMRRRQLEHRLLAQLAHVEATRILGGWLGEDDYTRLVTALGALHELPLFVDDRGGQTVWDIRATCRRLQAEKQIGLVIVDYIQLMHGTLDARENRNAQLSDISRRLKTLADELNCPVIVCSQLNRRGDERADKRPILSDLRDTGALEQDADLVCFLHRKHHREDGLTQFIIEKQRNGPTGVVNLTIERKFQTFLDGGVEPEQEALPEVPPAEEPRAPEGFGPRRRWRRE